MKSATSVVRISRHLDERLEALAAKTGRRKSYYASKAIEQYLEDREDYLLAVAAYEDSKGKRTYSLDEVEKRLGLAPGIHSASRKGPAETGRRRPAARKNISKDKD